MEGLWNTNILKNAERENAMLRGKASYKEHEEWTLSEV